MAKKAVASMQKGEGRGFSKVIKMVKSPKTGAYIFAEEIVLNEKVKDYFNFLGYKAELLPLINGTGLAPVIIISWC